MTDSSSGQEFGGPSFDALVSPEPEPPVDDLVVVEDVVTVEDDVSVEDDVTVIDDRSVADEVTVIEDGTLVDSLDRVRLFGLDLVNADGLEPVIEEILHGVRHDGELMPVVLTPNVDIVVHLDQAPSSIEAEMFQRAQLCLPDGQPLVMVSGFLGERLRARLPGSGLFYDLWPRIVEERMPAIVIASSDEISSMLEREHPKAGFIVPPMFDADDQGAIDEIVTEMLEAARAIRPHLILVGIGNPKDARIIASLFDRWDSKLGPKPLCLGLGGSFSMYLGLKKRAPSWIQKVGMEWFYRFLQEPRRLFHRYFVRDMAFFGIVRREWQASRSKR
ncbi:MAG: WecB/TagA/CpsF family glycosyltransferase [Acidimicrobiales bacterium]